MNRRDFVSGLALSPLAGLGFSKLASGQESGARPVRIELDPRRELAAIPEDFLGFGYEISSVSQPGLLDSKNRTYVQLVRTLGQAGVIRIGGNTSDYASWSPDGQAVSAPKATVVNRESVERLGTFLGATGWKLIWGFNLGRGSVEEAVSEAQAVAASAGGRLLAFEIGNEPDLFPGVHRPKTYGYPEYFSEYMRYKKAIRASLPDAPFAGPDVIVATDWLEKFAAAEARDIQLLTHHYYAEGPPENPASTIENLLKGNNALPGLLKRLRAASESVRVPYRICETNSCYGGGKPGVSDTLASALWGLDFLFQLAAEGAAGANLETGVNHLGFVSSYTPIGDDLKGTYTARPIYYGMLAFAVAGRGRLVGLDLDAGGLNLAVYAARAGSNRLWLTLINKEARRGAAARIRVPKRVLSARALRLTGPSLDAKEGVKLGGAMVTSEGQWKPARRERIPVRSGEFEIEVPAASSALVELLT